MPARLHLQVWDADAFSADDFIGVFNSFYHIHTRLILSTVASLSFSKDGLCTEMAFIDSLADVVVERCSLVSSMLSRGDR